MMHKKRILAALVIGVVAAFGGVSVFGPVASGSSEREYEVSITNLTKGQIISPVVVATHRERMDPLFTLGSAASPELAMVAEDAVNGPLVASLTGDANVNSVETIFGTGGPIMPGETASVVIVGSKRFDHVSLAAMLVTTNDAFTGLTGVEVPKKGTTSLTTIAYDAGSEANSEDCDHIPGPPCGSPGVAAPGTPEGYVYVHPGIQGGSDLVPADHDWRNPVAQITISRVGK